MSNLFDFVYHDYQGKLRIIAFFHFFNAIIELIIYNLKLLNISIGNCSRYTRMYRIFETMAQMSYAVLML